MKEPLPPYKRPVLPWERGVEGAGGPAGEGAGGGHGWMRWSSVGLEFGAAVALFFLGGRWLDARLSTSPWLSVTGALVGVAAGMTLLIRAALKGR